MTTEGVSRRGLLAGAAVLGVGVVGVGSLAACGDGGQDGGSNNGATGPVTVPAKNVPVGGAVIVGAAIVSQPTAGQYKAFSAVCTHQSCLISQVQGTTVECTCHGSTFSAVDGSVQRGPANRALNARAVTVEGDNLTVS
jgi:nitrite reductase/ring-hydroxylating ferredoxin subunit